MKMDHAEQKTMYKNTFNAVSDGYGHSSMRFFYESAKAAPSYLNLNGDEHVLDVATGTGYVALSLAKALPEGHVTGIDFSQGMLTQAMKHRDGKGIRNVTFCEMDMEAIDFQDKHFDAAVCAFSIFFITDMKKQLIHVMRKVKDGGNILMTTFSDNAFAPLVTLFVDRLKGYGIDVPSLSWKQVASRDQCTSLFKESGFRNVRSEQHECGYYLRDAFDWWYIIWNGGFRGLVNRLSPNDFQKFKEEHLAEVDTLRTGQGIWLDMGILYTVGEVHP